MEFDAMKKMLMMSLLLCGSFSLFGMNYGRLAQTGFMGATAGALAPAIISPSLPKKLIKEAPEAYAGIILFGGMLGIGYEWLSCPSKPKAIKSSMASQAGHSLDLSELKKSTLERPAIAEF